MLLYSQSTVCYCKSINNVIVQSVNNVIAQLVNNMLFNSLSKMYFYSQSKYVIVQPVKALVADRECDFIRLVVKIASSSYLLFMFNLILNFIFSDSN